MARSGAKAQWRSGRFARGASFRRIALGLGALVLTAPVLVGPSPLAVPAGSASLRPRVDLVTTVDFEGYGPPTEITNQYSGITFEYSAAAGFTYGTTPGTGVVRDVNGPPLVVASGAHGGSNGGELVRPGEFSSAGTFAALTRLADSVSVYVGDLGGAIGDHVELDAALAGRTLLDGPSQVPQRLGQPGGGARVGAALEQGADDPALKRLEAAKAAGPLRRVVLIRPPASPLARLTVSIGTLDDMVDAPFWLDLQSFGWTALTYLLAWNPRLQAANVPDHQVWHLARLGEELGRPVVLDDLSGQPAQPFKDLVRFDEAKVPAKTFKSLPNWSSSR